MTAKKLDVGIRVRANEQFRRLIDRAAQLEGKSRSDFVRDAALAEARRIILAANPELVK